jgi:hypothetical protein
MAEGEPMDGERRRRRSEAPLEAAVLWLETAMTRSPIRALTVANEDGFLLAGAGAGYDLDALAALGIAYAGDGVGRGFPEQLVEDVTLGDDLYAAALEVCGETLYLASVGSRLPRQREAAAALSRILAPALAGC